jgi:hypothetical protein
MYLISLFIESFKSYKKTFFYKMYFFSKTKYYHITKNIYVTDY